LRLLNGAVMVTKAEILAKLRQDILSLQGFKPSCVGRLREIGLGCINHSFPNKEFPLAGVHEFYCTGAEDTAASGGFIAGLLSSIINKNAPLLWVSSARLVFPPALQSFGIAPHQIIFIDVKKEAHTLWAVEEALKCKAVAAVIGELPEMSFKASRRFQLAIEQSGVSCFLLRCKPRNLATASLTRWRLKPLPSNTDVLLPGVGHPRWRVELLKARNGQPGVWHLEWAQGRFRHLSKLAVITSEAQKKAG